MRQKNTTNLLRRPDGNGLNKTITSVEKWRSVMKKYNSLFLLFITILFTTNSVYANASFYIIQERLKPDSDIFMKMIDRPLFLDAGQPILDNKTKETVNHLKHILRVSDLNVDNLTIYVSKKEIAGRAEASTIYHIASQETGIVIGTSNTDFDSILQIFYHEYAHYLAKKHNIDYDVYNTIYNNKYPNFDKMTAWKYSLKEEFAEDIKNVMIRKHFPEHYNGQKKTVRRINIRRLVFFVNHMGWLE